MGLFKKNQPRKDYFSADGFEVGDLAEFFYGGKWRIGEVEQSSVSGRLIIWDIAEFTCGILGDVELRKPSKLLPSYIKHYKELIEDEQDKINHRLEKERIAEYKLKLTLASPTKETTQEKE